MCLFFDFKLSFLLTLLLVFIVSGQDSDLEEKRRRLRILLFPRGSSLQLVYCLTVPTVDMPNIFVVGVTGSLAWELPYDPSEPYRKRAELLHRRIDRPTSGNGIIQDTHFRPSNDRSSFYHYSTLAKYPMNSTYSQWHKDYRYKYLPVRFNNFTSYNFQRQANANRRKYLHYKNLYRGYNTYDDRRSDYNHPIYNEFHRRSRRGLYKKIEQFLEAIRMNGKACVLKMLCHISKIHDGNGSFMEEVIKRIFRNKRSYYKEIPDEYDLAANKEHNCTDMYPLCEYF